MKAYNEFTLEAFKFSALDYLLKLVDTADLLGPMAKAERLQRLDRRQLDLLKGQHQSGQYAQQLAVPH